MFALETNFGYTFKKSDKSAVQAIFTFEPDIYYQVPQFKFVHHINISENLYQFDDGSDAGHLSSQPENKHGKKEADDHQHRKARPFPLQHESAYVRAHTTSVVSMRQLDTTASVNRRAKKRLLPGKQARRKIEVQHGRISAQTLASALHQAERVIFEERAVQNLGTFHISAVLARPHTAQGVSLALLLTAARHGSGNRRGDALRHGY